MEKKKNLYNDIIQNYHSCIKICKFLLREIKNMKVNEKKIEFLRPKL